MFDFSTQVSFIRAQSNDASRTIEKKMNVIVIDNQQHYLVTGNHHRLLLCLGYIRATIAEA